MRLATLNLTLSGGGRMGRTLSSGVKRWQKLLSFQIFTFFLGFSDEHCGEGAAEDGKDFPAEHGRLSLCGKVESKHDISAIKTFFLVCCNFCIIIFRIILL